MFLYFFNNKNYNLNNIFNFQKNYINHTFLTQISFSQYTQLFHTIKSAFITLSIFKLLLIGEILPKKRYGT